MDTVEEQKSELLKKVKNGIDAGNCKRISGRRIIRVIYKEV